jgi:hypothetical protein
MPTSYRDLNGERFVYCNADCASEHEHHLLEAVGFYDDADSVTAVSYEPPRGAILDCIDGCPAYDGDDDPETGIIGRRNEQDVAQQDKDEYLDPEEE